MGLFSKLRQNVNHGGVKVQVQAPGSVPSNQVIPVNVTLTADSAQTINSVKAELKARAKEEGLMLGNGGIGAQQSRTMEQTIAQVENRQPFTIAPGETKTVNLQLYIDGTTGNASPSGGTGAAANVINSIIQGLGHVHYIYSLHVSADVPGVALDPSDKMPIQILPAAQTQPTQPPAASQNPPTPPIPPTPTQPIS